MFEVTIEDCDEHSDIKDEFFVHRDFWQELVITHNGKEILRESDRCEPEDRYFSRDYKWVKPALEQAYKLGRADEHQYLINQLNFFST